MDDGEAYGRMQAAANPFGDGQASQRIVARLEQMLAPPAPAPAHAAAPAVAALSI